MLESNQQLRVNETTVNTTDVPITAPTQNKLVTFLQYWLKLYLMIVFLNLNFVIGDER